MWGASVEGAAWRPQSEHGEMVPLMGSQAFKWAALAIIAPGCFPPSLTTGSSKLALTVSNGLPGLTPPFFFFFSLLSGNPTLWFEVQTTPPLRGVRWISWRLTPALVTRSKGEARFSFELGACCAAQGRETCCGHCVTCKNELDWTTTWANPFFLCHESQMTIFLLKLSGRFHGGHLWNHPSLTICQPFVNHTLALKGARLLPGRNSRGAQDLLGGTYDYIHINGKASLERCFIGQIQQIVLITKKSSS